VAVSATRNQPPDPARRLALKDLQHCVIRRRPQQAPRRRDQCRAGRYALHRWRVVLQKCDTDRRAPAHRRRPHLHRQKDIGLALAAARGLSHVLPAGRPGDPGSDENWFVTDWMDNARGLSGPSSGNCSNSRRCPSACGHFLPGDASAPGRIRPVESDLLSGVISRVPDPAGSVWRLARRGRRPTSRRRERPDGTAPRPGWD
jgi:hypothetical protein